MKYLNGWSITTLSLCLISSIASAAPQESLVATSESNSAVERLKSDLTYLASDELKGRDTGSPEIATAGEFIANRFAELGLKTDSFDGTPYQVFSIPGLSGLGEPAKNTLVIEGLEEENQVEPELSSNYTTVTLGKNGTFDGELVFAGYGITATDLGYDDYEGLDVEGKVVIVLRKEPQQDDEDSVFEGRESSRYAYFVTKEMNAAIHKAAALIMVNDVQTAGDEDQLVGVNAAGEGATMKIPTIYATRDLIDPIVKQGTGKSLAELEAAIDEDLKPQSQVLEGISAKGETFIAPKPVRNVVGVLPGSGELADEYIVIGAHYDHVGMGGRGSLAPGTIAIHNGADDNGSGTVTLLEVARQLAENKTDNQRSIIFMTFTGEERGLLGSKHYARNPRFPLEDTVAMLNMDMVGRLRNDELTVYGTGTAKNFDALIEELNESAGFTLKKQEAGFGPSDHSSFYEKKIPVYHFFTGLHNEYHRPSDDVELVNFEGMARIAGIVTAAATEIATAPERPEYVRVTSYADVGRSRPPRQPRAVIGIQLDLEGDADGAPIASVPADGPAAEAGLEAGDVVIKIGNKDIGSVRDLRQAMSDLKPEQKIQVTVKRGDEEVEVEVTLGRG